MIHRVAERVEPSKRERIRVSLVIADGTRASADEALDRISAALRCSASEVEAILCRSQDIDRPADDCELLEGMLRSRGHVVVVLDSVEAGADVVAQSLADALCDGVDVAIATPRSPAHSRRLGHRALAFMGSCVIRITVPGVAGTVRSPRARLFAVKRRVVADVHARRGSSGALIEILAEGDYTGVQEVPCLEPSRVAHSYGDIIRRVPGDLTGLARLAWRTRHVHRFAKFCVVGLSGTLLYIAALAMCRELIGLPVWAGGALSAAIIVLSNFTLNELWTFADWVDPDRRFSSRLRRLRAYVAICGAGAVLNVGVLLVLSEWLRIHYLIAAVGGVAAATVWNYAMNATLTWRRRREGGLSG